MSTGRKLKRNLSGSEDYDSKPDSEDEGEEFYRKRSTKKKRICLDSGSESESDCLDKNILKNDAILEDTSEEDEPISNIAKKNASPLKGKSKTMQHNSSDSSEEEPIAEMVKKYSENSNYQNITKDVHSEREVESEISSDEASLNEKIKSSKTNGNSKSVSSASDSEDSKEESLAVKNKSSSQKSNGRKDKNQSNKNGDSLSSDEEPINKSVKGSKNVRKLQKKRHSSISSDDEPLATKITVNQKSKSPDNSDLSSDDEEKPLSSLSKTSKEKVNKKKDKNSSNGKIENLKKYLRVAGIHVNSYDKLFENCKSMKSKVEKLLGLLHEKGLKGRPTIEKCKKLKKKIETKKEIAELDVSNIIKTEGRPKRGAGGKIEKVQNIKNSPAAKKFARLRDIIDSEESD